MNKYEEWCKGTIHPITFIQVDSSQCKEYDIQKSFLIQTLWIDLLSDYYPLDLVGKKRNAIITVGSYINGQTDIDVDFTFNKEIEKYEVDILNISSY